MRISSLITRFCKNVNTVCTLTLTLVTYERTCENIVTCYPSNVANVAKVSSGSSSMSDILIQPNVQDPTIKTYFVTSYLFCLCNRTLYLCERKLLYCSTLIVLLILGSLLYISSYNKMFITCKLVVYDYILCYNLYELFDSML